MTTTETTDATRGPWFAIATDGNGFVLTEDKIVDECMFIVVGRGTAEPIGNRRMPDEAKADDVLYEIEFFEDIPERVATCWEQARAVAAALNAAGGAR